MWKITSCLAAMLTFVVILATLPGCDHNKDANEPVDVAAAVVLTDGLLVVEANPNPLPDQNDRNRKTCPKCRGAGTDGRVTCSQCNGKGFLAGTGVSDPSLTQNDVKSDGAENGDSKTDVLENGELWVDYVTFYSRTRKSDQVAFVIVSATWCAPCQVLKSRIRDLKPGKLIGLIDYDADREAALYFTQGSALPVLMRVSFHDGRIQKMTRWNGRQSLTEFFNSR